MSAKQRVNLHYKLFMSQFPKLGVPIEMMFCRRGLSVVSANFRVTLLAGKRQYRRYGSALRGEATPHAQALRAIRARTRLQKAAIVRAAESRGILTRFP
jgi:hypothetical protein